MPALAFGVALIVSLAALPAARWLAFRTGRVAAPRKDRWHSRPTPTLGGLAIFGGYLAGTLVTGSWDTASWALLAGGGLMFALGLFDDYRPVSPPTKLVGQMLAATLVIAAGYRIAFFNNELLNILLTFLWLVGITNAINLLDNMDGLAGGIALIVAGFLGYFYSQAVAQAQFFTISLALAGAALGFLVMNFPPAKIFMGDSGSLFLGFTLASLAVVRTASASNVFAVMGVPTLLFLLPILDTTLVMITRLLRGQSPAQGGRDHTSHRLIAFGLTERQAVLVLYGIALISGVAATSVENVAYEFSLLFVPVLIVSLSLLAAYLGKLQVVQPATPAGSVKTITRFVVELTYRQRILEILLDLFLISIAYYLALWTQFDLSLSADELGYFATSLPIALGGTYLSFFLTGVYRGVWAYIGLQDLAGYVRAVLGAVILTGAGLWLFLGGAPGIVPGLFLFGVFLWIGLAAARSSFRVLDQVYNRSARGAEAQVLLYGVGGPGELAARWMLMNPELGYRPVGFLDSDTLKRGRKIHGIEVLGGPGELAEILKGQQIEGLVITNDADLPRAAQAQLVATCQAHGLWVRRLRLEFELVE